MRYGFGVDIFGTEIKMGFFDEAGTLIEKWKIATPAMEAGNRILPAIADEIERYMAKHRLFEDDIIGIGVGIPGPVNSAGVVNKCVNFGWGVFNIDRALAGLTGLNVKASNIANLAALGECWKGSGTNNMIFVAMNTGLGGAVVCDGSVVYGVNGGAGEIGHMVINKEEPDTCTCGRRGCVEQYCSPVGIARMARRQLAATATPSVLRSSRRIFDYREVLNAAMAGDKVAGDVMNKVCDYMGHFLSNVCCVTNPDTIVLGGEFSRMNGTVVDGIARAFHKYIFHANENVRFEKAKLGTDACIYGAFKMVLDEFA